MTMYLPNSDIRPTGSEVAEFADAFAPLVAEPGAQSPKIGEEQVDTTGG